MRIAGLLLLLLTGLAADAADLGRRSVSLTRQFVVYCDDPLVRVKTVSFAEEIKSSLLYLLGQNDGWKVPIVITIERGSTSSPVSSAPELNLFHTEGGLKIELGINLRSENPNFQREIVRALLLEFAYRNVSLKSGAEYVRPPSWLVEGVVQYEHTRQTGSPPDVYKALMARNQVPSLADFLKLDPARLDPNSLSYYRACAFALLELLRDLPGGREALTAYVRALPVATGDSVARIREQFSMLGDADQTLEKWWSLSIARLAASDRHEGLPLKETENRLNPLLTLAVAINNERHQFAFEDYAKFIKLPQARALLRRRQNELLWLSVEANPLYRPIILEYQKMALQLARGKSKGVTKKLEQLATYRQSVLQHLDQVADYLNWIEATQPAARSDSFDGYLRVANGIAADNRKLGGPISAYLDAIEKEFR
jgi:hypothetical protein